MNNASSITAEEGHRSAMHNVDAHLRKVAALPLLRATEVQTLKKGKPDSSFRQV
jgi:hypothetical protein